MREVPEAGAAPVAAILLEFLKEPASLRPAFIHGQRALPQGDHVLRFAQGRFPHGLMRDLPPAQRDAVREAANAFIRQVCLRDGATHYQVLCLSEDAHAEVVKENYHLLIALIHPDRQDAAHWPKGAAQRVNGAYEVLSDDARRREYDDAMTRAAAPRPAPSQWEGRAHMPRGTRVTNASALLKPVAVVGGVVISLFALQVWWMSDVPHEFTTLERAMPLNVSSQWIREVLPGSARPRFLEARTASVSSPPESVDLKETDRLPLFAPLWRALGGSVERAPSRPRGPQVAKAEAKANANAVEVASVSDANSAVAVPALAPQPLERPITHDDAPARAERRDSPPTPASVPAEKPVIVAQAVQSPPAAAAAPKATPARAAISEDIEKLVIRLIGAYEAGDADRLMGLIDGGELGFFETLRVRSVFTDFFRATRQRRLQLDRLAWQEDGGKWRAQGEGTIVAEYLSDAGPTSRKVPVEMDIAIRDGKARITRLALFPNVK
jgi:hypothetical protein